MEDQTLDLWWRADTIFMEAIELPPAEWPAFIARSCGNDTLLREHVDQLIAALEASSAFLADPLLAGVDVGEDHVDAAPSEGRLVGRYRLIREIGHGGMGTVYLAERADGQFEQEVALKLVRTGLESREALHRFRLERQILARLQHPNIARLLDGGVSEDRNPYFVMEYVEGVPITEYADQHALTIEERLSLFRTVCQAVEYAHRNLIVHRDLKPTNILVGEGGEVKLLDFGIAKLLDREALGSPVSLAETRGRVMTPEYASPEQVRGEPITTASDVYQLGLLLYELLTGRRPYLLESRALHEVERVICEQEPERLPVAVMRNEEADGPAGTRVRITVEEVSRARGTRVEKLRRQLSGDLDTICLKALKKEPDRRYGSVAELSEDVRRRQAGLPVLARKDTLRYRAVKFVRRHKAAASATALIVLVLVGGILSTAWQARVARGQANMARVEATKAERINAFLQEMLSSVDPSNEGREVRVADVLDAAAEKVETELKEEPEIEAAVRSTIGITYQSLGMYAEAEPHLQHALEIQEALFGKEHLGVAKSMNDWAGLVLAKGDYPAAESLYREALAVRRRLLGPEHPDVAESLHTLARSLRFKGAYQEAESFYRGALAMQRKLLGLEHPAVAITLNNLASLLHARSNYPEAEQLYREALAMQRRFLGPEHPYIANTLNDLALLLTDKTDYPAAESLYREALALRRKQLGPEHPDVATTLNNLALLLHATGDYPEAAKLYREALGLQRALLGAEHPYVAASLNNLALVLHAKGEYPEAEKLYREALAMDRKFLGEHPDVALDMNNLASLLYAKGDYAAAESLYRQALGLFQKTLSERHLLTSGPLVGLGSMLCQRGDPQGAEPMLREAVEIRREGLPASHWRTAQAESTLGGCLATLGRYEEAEPLLIESYAVLKETRGEADNETHRARDTLIHLYEIWGKPEKAAAYQQPAP